MWAKNWNHIKSMPGDRNRVIKQVFHILGQWINQFCEPLWMFTTIALSHDSCVKVTGGKGIAHKIDTPSAVARAITNQRLHAQHHNWAFFLWSTFICMQEAWYVMFSTISRNSIDRVIWLAPLELFPEVCIDTKWWIFNKLLHLPVSR